MKTMKEEKKDRKLRRAQEKYERGELPKAVLFDEPILPYPISNKIWDEQYVVNYEIREAGETIWKKVEMETWMARGKNAHQAVEDACKKHHEAKNAEINVKNVWYC